MLLCFGVPPLLQRNTFQCVLATDGVISIVTFLYADIQWAVADSQTESGSGSGLSGSEGITLEGFATVGFSDGVQFDVIPGSSTEDIMNINSTSNIAVPGMWIFRVDGTDIESGGMLLAPSY